MKIVEYENIVFCVGETAKENWELLDKLRLENPDYLWFHLNSFPSPYVIMKTTLIELSSDEKRLHDCLLYAATLCKQNTRYRHLNDIKVCYTTLKKLKPGNKVGEVIISGKTKTIKL